MEAEDLRAVTINLNKGKLGGDTGPVRMIARQGASFTAPTAKHLTDSEGNPASADFVVGGRRRKYLCPRLDRAGNVGMLGGPVVRGQHRYVLGPHRTKTARCRGAYSYFRADKLFRAGHQK